MSSMLQNPTELKRLILSRYYLSLAFGHGRSSRELDVFATVNLLHEAAETFLVAAATHVNAAVGAREDFAGYFDKIDVKISPRQLPFRSKLIRLSKARNMAKHDSIVPDRAELPGFQTAVREFLEEASQLVFHADFRTVSLIDVLPDGRLRTLLQEAQVAFENGDFANTLIACRKAIYLQYEQAYDAKPFADGERGGLASFFSKVPLFARNPDYIKKHIREPTDYIVLDHSRIDSDLVKDGLDGHQFWNIWRLTPRVYLGANDRWIVRHEPDKVAGPAVAENAAYVLDNVIDHFIALERTKARQKVVGSNNWAVTAGPQGTRIFQKASLNSEISDIVPAGTALSVDGATEGLEGDAMFWKVSSPALTTGKWFYGYALQDEIKLG